MTGQAFKTGEIIIENQISKLANFQPSIDNRAIDCQEVKSIMVVPIYGHDTSIVSDGNGGMK